MLILHCLFNKNGIIKKFIQVSKIRTTRHTFYLLSFDIIIAIFSFI